MIPIIEYNGKWYLQIRTSDTYIDGVKVDKGWTALDIKPTSVTFMGVDDFKTETIEYVHYNGHVERPSYVLTEFPYWISEAPELWYQFPCRIESGDVFDLTLEVVRNACDGHQYLLYDFPQLGYFKVYERVPLNFESTEKVLTIKGKKKKWVQQKKAYEDFEIIHAARDSSKDGATPIKAIYGDNYKHLQQELQSHLDGYIEIITDGHREVCPHCKGYGVIQC